MKKANMYIGAFFVFVALFFFYPVFKNYVPFPGDLLIGEYTPYNTYSYLGYGPGAYPNKGQDFDVIRIIYPAKEFSIQQLQHWKIPLWNPYNFSGNPHLAGLQSGTFYPINILFFLLPFARAWTIYILIQPILAGIFTYILLREYSLSKLSSLFGGLSFAFSAFMTVWMEYGNLGHSILWLPLVILLIHKNLKTPSILKIVLIALTLSLSLLAGYIQTTMYVFIFSFVYALYYIVIIDRKKWQKNIAITLLAFISPLFITAFQLLPMMQLFNNSSRVSYSLSSFINLLIPLKHLITILVPDFFGNPATRNYWLNGTYIERVLYIGIIPAFFALYSLTQKPSRILIFYVICSLIIPLLVFDSFFTRTIYSLYLPPILSTGVPTRMLFLLTFALCILASFGLHYFEKKVNLRKFIITCVFMISAFILTWDYVILSNGSNPADIAHMAIAKRNLYIPSAILVTCISILFVSLIFNKYRKILLWLLVFVTVLDLFYFFQKITPFSPVATIYPPTEVLTKLKSIQGIDRSWGYGSAYIEGNIQTHEKIFSVDGYDPLHSKQYGKFITAGENGKASLNPPRSESVLLPGYGQTSLTQNKYRQTLMNILGIKYILNRSTSNEADFSVFSKENFQLIWQKDEWQIYQNRNSYPRFFLTSEYVTEKNPDKVLESLFSDKSPKSIILNDEIEQNLSIKSDPEAFVKLISYSPNEVIFKTNARQNQLLFLSDNFENGWNARVDHLNTKIYQANYTFRSIVVPKGDHLITFTYSPASFKWGYIVSGLFLLVGGICIIIIKRKK